MLQANWYVLLTEPQRELIAADKLTVRGFRSYCPIKFSRVPTGRRNASGKKETRERRSALFPGYAFVAFNRNAENWLGAERVFGVRRFLHIEGLPARLPTGLIETIWAREAAERAKYEDSIKVRLRAPFTVNQTVRPNDGPFSGFLGQVDALDDKGRVKALLSIFGRQTPVWLDGDILEAA